MTASRPAALIVDDQPFVGLVASDILRDSGFETFHAFGARNAVADLAKHPEIEVLLADADIAGDVDGIELCRRVSRVRPDVHLVLTTAGKDLDLVDVPTGTRVLRKPYASGELSTMIGARRRLAII